MAPTEFFSIIIHIVKGEAIFVLAVMFAWIIFQDSDSLNQYRLQHFFFFLVLELANEDKQLEINSIMWLS
jgi:hypothetical protein